MKLFATFAAGLIAACALTPIPAAKAQRAVTVERHHAAVRHDRRPNYRRGRAHRGARYRTVCRTRWNQGRRVRRCVRVRR